MNTELIYDLAILVASVAIIIVGVCLMAFTDLDTAVGTTVIGVGSGALGARSGRAYVSKQTSEPPSTPPVQ